jgi:Fe-S cluster assembly iron-binding protein IscA
MVNVTEGARRELKRLLLDNVDFSQARLRLMSRDEGELGLGIDIEMPGDKTVEYDGVAVLVVEEKLAENLHGVTIDVEETPEGSELVILHKN